MTNSNKTQDQDEEYISGNVERITFHSQETGFSVLKVQIRNKRDLVTVVGSVSLIFAGEFIQAKGKWLNDKSHGLQFKASFLKTTTPNTLEGIEKYLGSGLIRGIGSHFAEKLVKAFKEDVFEVIENDSLRLREVEGIGKVRAERITKSWAEQKVVREIMVFLQSHGVGTARAGRIYKTYGNDAIKIVSENPYRLAKDIKGIGFVTADNIARKLGIEEDSIIRAEAGISYALLEAASEGHCGLPKERLIVEAVKLLEIDKAIIEEALTNVLKKDEVISDFINDAQVIFLTAYYRYEQIIAARLKALIKTPISLPTIDLVEAIPWVEQKLHITLAERQRQAVSQAISSKVLVITGGPGTGKTTLVRSIITILNAKRVIIKLAAPTGRAAKRLSETSGLEAQTIHRLLDFKPGEGGFKHNAENPLKAELVVIDEASMIDVQLMSSLLKAIDNNSSLIIVGDIDQLPSVGPGNVLADIIDSHIIPVVKLTEIFRQASDSLIITNAHRINQGIFPIIPTPRNENKSKNDDKSGNKNKNDYKLHDFYLIPAEKGESLFNKAVALITKNIPKKFGFNPIQDIQVLCPMQQGGSGAQSFNIELQKVLNPPNESSIEKYGHKFTIGDKVMQIENNYDKEIYNGDIGFIRNINKEEQEVTIVFDSRELKYDFTDLDQLNLAYAITIHKSQGSEYPVVIIPLLMQHYVMLRRNLIYTGVTRGKKLVIILGEAKALALALKDKMSTKRYSKLKEMLMK